MKQNSSLQPRTSLKQRIILVIFGVFLFFVLLEAGLRLGGFILLSLQEHRNLQSIKQKGAYRIMCLGESTTEGEYPQFLEEDLNRRNIGVRFSVVDKGRTGFSTSAILNQVEYYLDQYHPDMVVTMMGVNDWGEHVPFEIATTSKALLFIRSFKTYKLTRLIWLHILAKAKEVGLYKPNQGRSFSRNLARIGSKENHAEPIPTEEAFEKAVELNPKDGDAYVKLGEFYIYQGKLFQAEDAFKKDIEFDPQNDRAYRAISSLYEKTGKLELAKEYVEKANKLRSGYYVPVTVNSYRKLNKILDKRGIKLVCVQYPMRDVEPLKKIFEQDQGVIFVDNQKVFKEAVKKVSYKEYFRDMFGGDFGHCTEKGNRLLAQNIAEVIFRKVFK